MRVAVEQKENPMRIVSAVSLPIPEIKVIRFRRFMDQRGYFTEPFRSRVLFEHPGLVQSFKGVRFQQSNESLSKSGVMRGLHFQWNPCMGKMVRTLRGHMYDIVLDIRKGSPTFGRVIIHDMPYSPTDDHSEWIWVPPGFAHGNFFTEESQIEYFCSGEYSQGCEAGISPLAGDIDWSLCDPALKSMFDAFVASPNLLMTDKDRNGLSVAAWASDSRYDNFVFATP